MSVFWAFLSSVHFQRPRFYFPTSILYLWFNFRYRIPPRPFFTSLFLFLYHLRRSLQLLPPFLFNPYTPSNTYPLPSLRPRTCPVLIGKKITTSIMVYYRIAPPPPLCCCLVSWFQLPLRPRFSLTANPRPLLLLLIQRPIQHSDLDIRLRSSAI
jgi:hypothetical protein